MEFQIKGPDIHNNWIVGKMDKSSEMSLLGHVVVITGDYPAPDHINMVFVQQLVDTMIDQGVNITVIAPQSIVHSIVHNERILPQKSYLKTTNDNRYEIYRPYIITIGNSRFFSSVIRWWNRKKVNKLLKVIKPDVLYAHFWSSALYVNTFALCHKIPLFVACGEGDNALEEMMTTLSSKELKRLTSVVAGVISVSSVNKRKCIDYHLAKDNKIGVFPNCVDTSIFRPLDKTNCRSKLGLGEDDFIIAFVGGFNHRKGPDRLAQAISLIKEPTIKVMFIGKPFPGYPLCFNCPGIVYKGPVGHDDLPFYLNAADVFVLPTLKEGCCNAIVEALSVGLPVISSNGAFNDDILDEKNSIRISPNDIQAIKDAIIKLKNNTLLRDKMRKVSIRRHLSYSVKGRAQRIIDFLIKNLTMNAE